MFPRIGNAPIPPVNIPITIITAAIISITLATLLKGSATPTAPSPHHNTQKINPQITNVNKIPRIKKRQDESDDRMRRQRHSIYLTYTHTYTHTHVIINKYVFLHLIL